MVSAPLTQVRAKHARTASVTTGRGAPTGGSAGGTALVVSPPRRGDGRALTSSGVGIDRFRMGRPPPPVSSQAPVVAGSDSRTGSLDAGGCAASHHAARQASSRLAGCWSATIAVVTGPRSRPRHRGRQPRVTVSRAFGSRLSPPDSRDVHTDVTSR